MELLCYYSTELLIFKYHKSLKKKYSHRIDSLGINFINDLFDMIGYSIVLGKKN